MKKRILGCALLTFVCPQLLAEESQQAIPAANTINCSYKIPAETKTLDQALIKTWAEKATTQAFDFTPEAMDAQLEALKACFTNEGWFGFTSALNNSGNKKAIQTQKLSVSSLIDGKTQINDLKDNQWKLSVPLQVVYQNEREKVTQLLNIDLIIGLRITGDLGIIQMIATPRANSNIGTPASSNKTQQLTQSSEIKETNPTP